jgi:exonuclease III
MKALVFYRKMERRRLILLSIKKLFVINFYVPGSFAYSIVCCVALLYAL